MIGELLSMKNDSWKNVNSPWKILEKSWNFDFLFLYEPCPLSHLISISSSFGDGFIYRLKYSFKEPFIKKKKKKRTTTKKPKSEEQLDLSLHCLLFYKQNSILFFSMFSGHKQVAYGRYEDSHETSSLILFERKSKKKNWSVICFNFCLALQRLT